MVPTCLAAPLEGFGDATDQEIAEIRAGTYLGRGDDNSRYNFQYKVAADTEQTYISMEESRDLDTVTGSYSYVDPFGSLIVVNYSAGPQGYSETREVQENFVTIRARPVRTQTRLLNTQRREPVRLGASRFESQRRAQAEAAARAQQIRLNAGAQRRTVASTTTTNSQDNIVAQILNQISPLVGQSVSSAVGQVSRPVTRPITRVIAQQPTSFAASSFDSKRRAAEAAARAQEARLNASIN